ncbi:hypothetical protein [Paracraurococcus ruber]|uniref:hypothetical protein n=1 Tax=Paracraurococcus ruber TaxID=77675 RepID=UPI00130509BB|nr:hypothetical protein [Paracraurococcus ruber]
MTATVLPGFDSPDLLPWLEAADATLLDLLPFGVVRLDRAGCVTAYNAYESERAGLRPATVMGRPFFSTVGICGNNPLVAGRYAAEPRLDALLDYVFTFRLRPVPVRLRLLQAPEARHAWLLVCRRAPQAAA